MPSIVPGSYSMQSETGSPYSAVVEFSKKRPPTRLYPSRSGGPPPSSTTVVEPARLTSKNVSETSPTVTLTFEPTGVFAGPRTIVQV